MNVIGNAMWRLQCKLKTLSKNISQLSRNIIGNVKEQVSIWEAKVQALEELDILNNTEHDREELNKGHAEYVRWMGMQDSLLRQKARIKWFKDRDCNSKFFHNVLRDKRKRLQIYKIKNHRNRWVQGEDKIARATIKYYNTFFNLNQPTLNHDLLQCIPQLITKEENIFLNSMPNKDEVREAIFTMNPDSAVGLDGYNGIFFQTCWNIAKQNIMDFVAEFFNEKELTKFYTHTCLALIPKVENHSTFSDLRPISLSNYTNKTISRIISRRLNPLLNKLVSRNQSDFISSRLITENVMLTQKIIHNISKMNTGKNIVLKLDMAKTYDRMSWTFLVAVLKRFGFSDAWINSIWRLISNVWYSVLISRSKNRFFSSSQGLKQGDALSPSLFSLASEVLSRSLNNLHNNNNNNNFIPFSMNQRGPQINHFAYADDIIIFSSGNSRPVKLIMKQITNYEKASGQGINMIRAYTGFMDKTFSFTYLGCPIYVGRKKICYFDDMFTKVVKRLNGWQGRFKINTYGSFLGNNSRAGIREVIRSEIGDLVMPFSIPIQCNSNNQAEAQATKYEVDWCCQNGIRAFDLELDSLILTNMLKNEDTNNLKLRKMIKHITSTVSKAEVHFIHCFREANQVADSLTKLALSSGNGTFYYSFQQLPKEVKGHFQLDEWQLPSIRRRYDKSNFFVS
uniref:Reverse transcriptase domain-containing protein n=1 Tax=Nicotiana tabacum TaxID=4097 RepID=A0A1S4CTR7_TOBAC|nr:PREDICTED: uncharacterized protein LOC107822473 [Nicotiana tabacum]